MTLGAIRNLTIRARRQRPIPDPVLTEDWPRCRCPDEAPSTVATLLRDPLVVVLRLRTADRHGPRTLSPQHLPGSG